MLNHPRIGPLVVRQRFFEAVLPVKDIPCIDFQPRNAPRVAQLCEDLPCLLGRFVRAVILAHQN